jgi:hypothetical protein
MFADERCPSITIYSSQRFLHCHCTLPDPICFLGSTKSEASVHHQRPAPKYADSFRQSAYHTKQDRERRLPGTCVLYPVVPKCVALNLCLIYLTEVLPLVYNALESEHAVVGLAHYLHSCLQVDNNKVQERALNAVPGLCETIDYAEVSNVLFPRVAVRTIVISDSFVLVYNILYSWYSPKRGYYQSKSLPLQPS